MSKFTDQQYLKTEQYRDSSNLDARAAIHMRFSTNPLGWFNWFFDHLLKLPEDAKILELGCGPAYLWQECSSRIPAGWKITLSDLSSGMLDAAWRNLVVTGRTFKFEEIDAQSIPYADETFDAVIANFMLYHIPDRQKAISEIKRVLKPGGYLFAATVGENHLKKIMEWIRYASIGDKADTFAQSFTLENGLEQLASLLPNPNTQLIHYSDSLRVTEVEPLMAYICSSIRVSEVSEEKLEQVRSDLENELVTNGEILITKDSGLFEAIK
jgi:ubiquinone/menaquinone biosynthesis C-methylase UbiE